jgi:hypothetical protein
MSEPTVTFDTSRQQVTIELYELPTEDAVEKISARLRKDQPRSVIVTIDWRRDPDRRQISQLVKALNPSLNAFIFEAPYDRRLGTDICEVLEACPNLQRAFLGGASTMRGTRHEQIRELLLMGNQLDASVIPGLAASQFPALETLALFHEKLEGFQPNELAASLRPSRHRALPRSTSQECPRSSSWRPSALRRCHGTFASAILCSMTPMGCSRFSVRTTCCAQANCDCASRNSSRARLPN